jgi:hypothetical protein
MDGKTSSIAEVIEAQLNYLRPGDEAPYSYAYDPPAGVPPRFGGIEPHTVPIRNGRVIADLLSLDREGFQLCRHVTDVVDFYDADEVRRVYYPEVEQLAKEVTGAAEIVIFDHTVRNTTPEKQSGRRVRAPAGRVHNDYTEASAPQRVRDLLSPKAADARLKRRYVEINLWRPISGPVKSSPLAVCDARTVEARDLVTSELRYPDRIGETYAVTYNSRHRWFYFPDMQADEALFIKCFDSAKDGRARISVHTAFDDPTTPPNAPPRESIEVRMFAFF